MKKERYCEEQQSQSGWGDEAISCIELTHSILGDCFVALSAAQDSQLLLAMTIFQYNDSSHNDGLLPWQ